MPAPSFSWPAPTTTAAVVIAGCIWGLFNAAIGMIFGFGTTMLVEQGWSLAAAGSATSLVLWLIAVSVPAGGVIADKTGRPMSVMLAGFVVTAIALFFAAQTQHVLLLFTVLGLAGGVSAGPIMSLPARILAPPERAVGMGLYFTLFYVMCVVAPIIAGQLSAWNGSAHVAFSFGAVMLLLCVPAYWLFEAVASRAGKGGA